MKIQKLFKLPPEDPKSLEPFASLQELLPSFEKQKIDHCHLLIAHIEDEDFQKLLDIFPSKEEAMGAFLSFAMEKGWEEVPKTYCIYHAQEEEGKLIAGIMFDGNISLYQQTTVEQMVQLMASLHRVIVYSYEVTTYIKDIYPEMDQKAYVIAVEIVKRLGRAPELSELTKIYGMPYESLEEKLPLIEKLLINPIRTPYGEGEVEKLSVF